MEKLTAQQAREICLQNIELSDKDNKEIDEIAQVIIKCAKRGFPSCVLYKSLRTGTMLWLLSNGYMIHVNHAHHNDSGKWIETNTEISWGFLI